MNNCICGYCKKDLNAEDCLRMKIEEIPKDANIGVETEIRVFCGYQCLIKYLQEETWA